MSADGAGGRREARVAAEAGPSRWSLRLPVALILVALVALVIVPLGVRLYTDRLEQYRDEVGEPARDLVNTIQLSLAREMGALRGFVITEDEGFLLRYEEALRQERRAAEALAPLVERLGPETVAAFEELGSRVDRWHGRVTEAEILRRQLVPENFIERIPTEELLYEEALEAVEKLRERIVAEVDRQRSRMLRAEGVSLATTTFLALLAFGAALAVLWLGRRLRAYASAAENRRLEMERVSENRAILIRGITHDLKNPLGAARNHLQLIRQGVVTDPEAKARGLERSERAIDSAIAIIDDLLLLARAEQGQLPMAFSPTDLAALLREVVGDQKGEAQSANVALRLDLPDDGPMVNTDYRRVREIVRNILSNAIKYTPDGGHVTLRLDGHGQQRDEPDNDWVAIQIADTGPGIPPGDLEKIFQEFARLPRGKASAEGSGLGLAISRRIARLLGGDIVVRSDMGRGSVFTLRLPRSAARRGHM
ncbi:MAG: ATP-binding protein [Gemmatimonadota bacterium]